MSSSAFFFEPVSATRFSTDMSPESSTSRCSKTFADVFLAEVELALHRGGDELAVVDLLVARHVGGLHERLRRVAVARLEAAGVGASARRNSAVEIVPEPSVSISRKTSRSCVSSGPLNSCLRGHEQFTVSCNGPHGLLRN